MTETINFKGEDFSEYSIEIVDGSIEMNWYYRGSISGGTGTEGGITVGIEKISHLLEEIKCKDLGELLAKIKKYQIDDWQFLKEKMREGSTGSWSWNETD